MLRSDSMTKNMTCRAVVYLEGSKVRKKIDDNPACFHCAKRTELSIGEKQGKPELVVLADKPKSKLDKAELK